MKPALINPVLEQLGTTPLRQGCKLALLLFLLFRHMPSLIHRSRSAWCLFHMKVCCKWCSFWS